jgi:catechol 2,3-dioxygenase-like lactoylglutathione lyase family enzyme
MRVHHIALRTADVEALVSFYGATLGLDVLRPGQGGSVWLDAGGTIVMIERADAAEPDIPPGTMELVAFAVKDKEEWRRRLEGASVAIESETAYTLYFRDPDGRRVAVSALENLVAPL